jgi:hypothetical protein
MYDALAEFFTGGRIVKKVLLDKFLAKLREILAFVESHGKFRIYSSSLLFLYDAEDPNPESPKIDLRMVNLHISFSNVVYR